MMHRGVSRSKTAATLLRESGFEARALDGGFPAWEQAGFPVTRGKSADGQHLDLANGGNASENTLFTQEAITPAIISAQEAVQIVHDQVVFLNRLDEELCL